MGLLHEALWLERVRRAAAGREGPYFMNPAFCYQGGVMAGKVRSKVDLFARTGLWGALMAALWSVISLGHAAESVVADPPRLDLQGRPGEVVQAEITLSQAFYPNVQADLGTVALQGDGDTVPFTVVFRFTIPQSPDRVLYEGTIVVMDMRLSKTPDVIEIPVTVRVLTEPVVLQGPAALSGRPGDTVSGVVRVVQGDPPFDLQVSRGALDRSSGIGLDDPVTFTFTIPETAKPGERFPVRVVGFSALDERGELEFTILVRESAADLLESLGRTPSQREMGRVIGTVCSQGLAGENLQRDCDALIRAAEIQDPNAAVALAQVTPDQVYAPADASQTAMQAQMRNIGARLAALRAGARGISLSGFSLSFNGQPLQLAALSSAFMNGGFSASAGDGGVSGLGTSAGGRLGVFINGDVRFGSRDRTALTEGFDFNTYGITAGVDYRFLDTFVAGVSVGYTNKTLDIDGSRGELDSDGWTGSLYGTWYKDLDERNSLYLDGLFSYGALGHDQTRALRYAFGNGTRVDQRIRADFDSSQWSLSLGGGYRWQRSALSVGPVARLEYVSASIDGYDETVRDPSVPGGGWRVHIGAQDVESLTTRLGVDLSYAMSQPWGVLVPQLTLDWVHEFKLDPDPLVGHFLEDPARTPFLLQVDAPDRDYFNLGIGAVAQLPHGMSGFVFYRKLLGYDILSMDSISFGLRMEF